MKNGAKPLTYRVGGVANRKSKRLGPEEAKAKDAAQLRWLNSLRIQQVVKATVKE